MGRCRAAASLQRGRLLPRRPPRQGESPVRVGGSDVVVDHAGATAFGSRDLGFSRPALGGDGHPPFSGRYEQD